MSDNSTVYISELKNHVGQDVTLQGWLYKGRASGKVQFLIVRDGTGLCQCVVEKGKVSDEQAEAILVAWAELLDQLRSASSNSASA